MNLTVKHIDKYVNKGIGSRNWYSDTKKTLLTIFPENDIDVVIDILAVTSMNATLKSNVSHTLRAYYQYKNGMEFTGFLPNVVDHLNYIRNGQRLSGRKVRNFAKAIKGNPSSVVVDLWIMRAFGSDKNYPNKKEYDFIEDYLRVRSLKYGLEPRQMQASIWIGVRGNNRQVKYCDIFQSKIKSDLFTQTKRFTSKYIYV